MQRVSKTEYFLTLRRDATATHALIQIQSSLEALDFSIHLFVAPC
jgi:hypothetical protein